MSAKRYVVKSTTVRGTCRGTYKEYYIYDNKYQCSHSGAVPHEETVKKTCEELNNLDLFENLKRNMQIS